MVQIAFPFNELQEAIYGALSTDITTTDIYDYPQNPEEDPYPYILVGDYASEEESTKVQRGQLVTADISVYSSYRGMQEVNAIMDQVAQSISGATLTLTGFESPLEMSIEAEVRRTFDGIRHIRHGVVRVIFQVYQD